MTKAWSSDYAHNWRAARSTPLCQFVAGLNHSMTWSIVELASVWRGGNSWNVFGTLPTIT